MHAPAPINSAAHSGRPCETAVIKGDSDGTKAPPRARSIASHEAPRRSSRPTQPTRLFKHATRAIHWLNSADNWPHDAAYAKRKDIYFRIQRIRGRRDADGPSGRLNRPGRPGSCSPQPCHRLQSKLSVPANCRPSRPKNAPHEESGDVGTASLWRRFWRFPGSSGRRWPRFSRFYG